MKYLFFFLFITYLQASHAQSTDMIQGRVTAFLEKQALPGVNVIVKGTTHGVMTDKDGQFTLKVNDDDTLVFSFIGYETQAVPIKGSTDFNIVLVEGIELLQELDVFSTGYEVLPKERATGAFAKVDHDLMARKVGTDVLSRLEDVTSGVLFNRTGSSSDPISIRGRSTIFANANPLIVIDNFPYDGALENINPNDVESISVLKDAAAASIWGARAGNGVIVITTKKGRSSGASTISFNSNITVGEKPDAFYVPQMSVSDYIDTEKALFAQGYYTPIENAVNKRALSPVAELLVSHRDGLINSETLATEIAMLKQHDVRSDYNKYLYQRSINQQYSFSIHGGSKSQSYFVSTGYDKNTHNLIGDGYERFTLHAKNNWFLWNDKLEVFNDVYFTKSNHVNNSLSPATLRMTVYDPLFSYARLADDQGSALPVIQDYRRHFIDEAQRQGLLDWQYRPLQEMKAIDRRSKSMDYRVNAQVRYHVTKGLSIEGLYQYWHTQTDHVHHYSPESYYSRNLINQFTQVDDNGNVIKNIPMGGIRDLRYSSAFSNNVRAQLNYHKQWRQHEVWALGGYEVKEVQTEGTSYRFYGYTDALASSGTVDYVTRFPLYHYPVSTSRIPENDSQQSLTDRFISFYGNAAYTFKQRYTLSVSARKDQSNLFGVKANQKGVPLWSTGLSWLFSEESFYKISFLPYVKFRATYGYNGNIDKTVTALTTAQTFGTNQITGLPYARITNAPNPFLQWEKIQSINVGVDFEVVDHILNGSIDYYQKNGKELIGFATIAPSTGQVRYKGNTASSRGNGVDIALNTLNIDRAIRWQTHFLFSFSKIKITQYKEEANVSNLLNYGHSGAFLLEGNSLYGLYSYPWAGLDPETGDPRGYVDGNISKDYTAISTLTKPEDLIYHGPARPTVFGSLRNTLSWRNFSASFVISYRFGYYFRRPSISYGNNRGLGGHGDYYARWQYPGDERKTDVPSLPENFFANRDNLYTFSAALVERGDHIRFQDIQLAYTLNRSTFKKLPFQRVQLYGYTNNVGMLWKATDKVPDPDYLLTKVIRTYAFGIKMDF